MKASYYRIETSRQESFRCRCVSELNFATPWHFHPEYQITLVVRGTGHRLVGDNIAEFGPGDLTIIGPNLPHFWRHDEGHPVGPGHIDALMTHFQSDFLGPTFLQCPEASTVRKLLCPCLAASQLHS